MLHTLTTAMTSFNQSLDKKESHHSFALNKKESYHIINQFNTRSDRILPELKIKLIEPQGAVSFIPAVSL